MLYAEAEGLVRYSALHLTSTYSPALTTQNQLYGLVESDMPGMVVRHAGDSLEEAIDKLPLPPEIEPVEDFTHPFVGESTDGSSDLPLHYDPAPSYRETLLVFHYTAVGQALATLFRPGMELVRRMQTREGLPPQTESLFLKGLVDPSILNPKAYRAALTAGCLLIFKVGGPSPLVHHFKTTKAPRHSLASWGIIRH